MRRDKNGWRVEWRRDGRRYSFTSQDKKEVERFELELKLGVAEKARPERYSPTFAEYSERWLRDYCRVEKAETQWASDERMIRLRMLPAFGGVRLRHLRKSHLLDLRSQLSATRATNRATRLSPKSVNLVLALAKKMMATAVELELVGTNPFAGVKLLRVPDQRFDFWLPLERDTFLVRASEVDPEFCRLVLVACHTGLRLGELAALTRADLDFERRMLHVGKSFDVNLARLMPTKNKRVADVPMNERVYEALGPKRFLQADALVFDRGLFWSAVKRLRRLCLRVGTRPIRFHDLRHTFASTLAMAGVDLMLIQRLMRHQSYQMTLRYAHLHPDHLKGATDVLCAAPVPRQLQAALKSGGPRGT